MCKHVSGFGGQRNQPLDGAGQQPATAQGRGVKARRRTRRPLPVPHGILLRLLCKVTLERAQSSPRSCRGCRVQFEKASERRAAGAGKKGSGKAGARTARRGARGEQGRGGGCARGARGKTARRSCSGGGLAREAAATTTYHGLPTPSAQAERASLKRHDGRHARDHVRDYQSGCG